MMKLFFAVLVSLFFLSADVASAKMPVFKIDAQRNAVEHNNKGVVYMQDRYYAPAIKEFEMAILLDSDTQASAVYYANLANCHLRIGYPALAQDSLEKAIKRNPMNLMYYQDLVETFKMQKILDKKLEYYKKDSVKNPLSQIVVGFILIESGKNNEGIAKLLEFVHTEPDLIISKGVKKYIDERSVEKF